VLLHSSTTLFKMLRVIKTTTLFTGVFTTSNLIVHKYQVSQSKYADTGFANGLSVGVAYKWYGHHLRRLVDEERAHRLAIRVLSWPRWIRSALGLVDATPDDPVLWTSLDNKFYLNPIGMAAGFDKSAECVPGLWDMGFGCVEVGTVTRLPRQGNVGRRLWRDETSKTITNRYGMPNDGVDTVAKRAYLATHQVDKKGRIIGNRMGVNVSMDDLDWHSATMNLERGADYIVINTSCPSVAQSVVPNGKYKSRVPVLVKLSPTIDDPEDVDRLIDAGFGFVVCNTASGLSGPPLKQVSTELIKDMRRRTRGQVPIIGVGGISTGQDAYDKIRAGASLVQVYTSFVFEGPVVVHDIKCELAALLKRDGFTRLQDAVGVDVAVEGVSER